MGKFGSVNGVLESGLCSEVSTCGGVACVGVFRREVRLAKDVVTCALSA